jgi:hypothetical protein
MLIKVGNLLDVTAGAICHQVNLKGVMGAGLAKQIREKYPVVFSEYQLAIQRKELRLGGVQRVQVNEALWVFNLACQENYGRAKGTCYTNYDAVKSALTWVRTWQECTGYPVYLPYGMGAGLAGGDWERMEQLIEQCLPIATVLKLA